MNIAFLFNSDHGEFGGSYGSPIRDRLLDTDVLQGADRRMRVSLGDILTYGAVANAKLVALCRAVYTPTVFDRLNNRLADTHGRATVYCWLFRNMTMEIGESLNERLSGWMPYLGAMDVDFANPLHLRFFRLSLIEKYLLQGPQCWLTYAMGDEEGLDWGDREAFQQHGFTVGIEDTGARKTVFDNFDTLDHYRRIADFEKVFATISGLNTDKVSDLVLMLEDIHPRLFDAFAAAARALARAETQEDLAQAALSGRRLIEMTADSLFPARVQPWKGHLVDKPHYGNRLWAYLTETANAVGATSAPVEELGNELDRLIEVFNAGLHAMPTKVDVDRAFRDLVLWLTSVVNLSPQHAARPYEPFEDVFRAFLKDWLDKTRMET